MQAQKKLLLTVITKDSLADNTFKLPDYQKKFEIPADRNKEIQKLVFTLYNEAYLAASVDSTVQDSVMLKAYVTHGSKYEWAYLNKGNVDEGALSQVGYRDKIYQHVPFYYKDFLKFLDKILSFYEDHGYPFAKIKLDSVKLAANQISASLNLQKLRMIKIDSVILKGNLKISKEYIYGYLGIRPGDLYNETKVRAISGRLKALPFMSESKQLQVIFVEDKAKIYLFLDKKSADQINGIIGILPGTNPTTQASTLTVTGDINLQLINTFHDAEEIGIHWQHTQALTQNLTMHFSYPYLFKTPIGIDEDFKLFKQDTTYLQLDNKIGLKYLLIGGDYFKVFYESISSSLIATSALQYQTSGLPDYADVSTHLYGVEYKTNRLDYIYNPRRGYTILLSVAAGTKDIRQNPALNPQIYDGLQLKSDEYRGNLKASYYIPFFSRSAFMVGYNAGYIDAPSLLLDDMYRIGGFSLLRGFDEQSIYANIYSIGTVEFHYLLEQNSFMYLFYDFGWYRGAISTQGTIENNPYGFGVGMDFQTKAGIFSISYALGADSPAPINFKDGKINFGIINSF